MRHRNTWTHPVTRETYCTTWTRIGDGPKMIRNKLTTVDGDKPPRGYVGEIKSGIPRVMVNEDDDE